MYRPFLRIRRTYAQAVRLRHIMAVLVKYGFEEVAAIVGRRFRVGFGAKRLRLAKEQNLAVQSPARRVRLAMEELGPTFIKMGQLLSTRPDLVPVEYIEELELLQDQVKPEKTETIIAELTDQLGGKPEEIFADFQLEPIAAASIAQVHRARTKDGRECVVKIRRPGIVQTIRTECEILENLAGLVQARFAHAETFDPQRMIREFSRAVGKEVDLANERRNQKRFLHNFADDETIHVPRIYDEYCSEGALTMEYIDGIKPSEIEKLTEAGLDRRIIAQRGADFVLTQVFDHGFFHTDPHPGNFLVMKDNVLAPLDFGQVGRLSSQDRQLLRYIVLAIVDGDVNKIIQGLERAEMMPDSVSLIDLQRDMEEILDSYSHLPLRDIPFREAIGRGFDAIRKHRIRPPADFTLMLKSLMTIESFASSLDPDFQIIEHLKPYARKFTLQEIGPGNLLRGLQRMTRDAGQFAQRLPDDAATILSKFRRGQFRIHVHHEHLENLNQTLDKSSNRISFALIIAALLIGSSLLIAQDGTFLGLFHLQTVGVIGYVIAAAMGFGLLISILRSNRL
ncbi:MAG: AarF/ABC1/UbiB kinase family protein [Sedimentisphaerales bacterium]|nr:AarF/ABC1/UbiB kinase family protein [Sedimentisphaerales bacterium]